MSAKFTTLREHFSTFFEEKMIEILTLSGDFGAQNYIDRDRDISIVALKARWLRLSRY